MNDLPPGWEWHRVADVADVRLGRQRSPQHHSGDHMRPYLRAANVTWSGLQLDDVKRMNFNPEESVQYELRDGDILLNEASGSPNEVGKPAIWRNEIPGACFQNTLLRVRSRGPMPEYLHLYFWHTARSGRFGDAGRGVNIRHLGKQGLAEFLVPIPPIDEQQRIVEATQDLLSHFQAAARLVEQTRARLRATRQAFVNAELRRDWPMSTLGEHTVDQRYGTSAKSTASCLGVPVLRMGNVQNGRIDYSDLKYLPSDHPDLDVCDLRPGDLLFNRTNSPELVGKSAVYDDQGLGRVSFASYLIRVRLADDLLPNWAAEVINGPMGRAYISRVRTQQVGQANVNGTKLRDFPMPVPPLQDQTTFLERLTELDRLIDRLDAAALTATRRSSVLRSSILAAAFSGRLTQPEAVSV